MAEREPLLGPSQGEAPFHIIFGPLSVEFDMRLLLACDAGLSLVAVSAIGVSVGDALVLSLLRIAAFFGDDGGGLFLDAVSTTLLLALFRLALLAFSENVSPYNLATFVSASCVCALAEVLASSLATTPSPPQQLHGTSVHSSSPVRHSASDVQIVSIHVRDEAATPPLAHNDPANSFEFPDLLENALNAKELKYDDDGASDYGIDAATPTGRNHLTPLFAKAAAFSSSLPNTSHIRIADEDSEAESAERPNMSSSMFVTAENAANAIYRKYNQQSVKLDEKSQAAQETLDDAKGNSSSAQEHITSVSSITLTIHHPLIKEAVDHMWNGEYRQAETLLRDPILGGNVASSIRASVHLAELHTLIQFVSASDSDISKTMESLKNAENLIKRVLDSSNALMQSFASLQFGEGPLQEAFYALFKLDVECCYADILFFKGIHQVLMGREIKGTATLRASLKLYKSLENRIKSLNPTLQVDERAAFEAECDSVQECIQFGCAMFDLILEIVPSTLASILKAIGFTSNRGPACATLHAFAAGSSLRAPMAAFVLALDSASFMAPIGVLRMRKWSDETMLGRTPEGAFVAGGAVHPSIVAGVRGLAEGMKVVERALERWRSSPLFNLLAYYLHRKLGNTEDAEVFLNQAISWVDPEVVPYPTTLWFEMGCLLTFKCDWQSARKIFNSIWNFAGSVQQLNGISWDALNQSPQVPFSSPANARNGSLSTSDWFEFRPMAGLMLVGCMRAEEGPDLNTGGLSYETAKAVRKEIVLAVSSRRIKKTRIVKFAILLLEWTISRPGAIHPLLIHAVLLLRRDIHRVCLNPYPGQTTRRILYNLTDSLHSLVSNGCGLEDASGRGLVLLLQGCLFKCWILASRDDALLSVARDCFGACLQMGEGTWVAAHSRYEVAELDLLWVPGRWNVVVRDLMAGVLQAEERVDPLVFKDDGTVKTWGRGALQDISDEVSEDVASNMSLRTVQKQTSNMSLGSVEVLTTGDLEQKLVQALHLMALALWE